MGRGPPKSEDGPGLYSRQESSKMVKVRKDEVVDKKRNEIRTELTKKRKRSTESEPNSKNDSGQKILPTTYPQGRMQKEMLSKEEVKGKKKKLQQKLEWQRESIHKCIEVGSNSQSLEVRLNEKSEEKEKKEDFMTKRKKFEVEGIPL